METQIHHLPFNELPAIKRSDGIVNFVIAGPKQGTRNIKSGITRMSAGTAVPRHSHNAEEVVTVLEGRLRLTLGDKVVECGQYDSTYISAGVQNEPPISRYAKYQYVPPLTFLEAKLPFRL